MPDDQRQPDPPPPQGKSNHHDRHHEEQERKPIPKARGGRLLLAGIVVAVLLAVILVAGTLARLHAHAVQRQTADANTVPTVTVVHPMPLGGDTLTLPARLDAWTQAGIYARVDGYLSHWYYDIGAKVPAGAVLATIDTPETEQQLAAAKAALATAGANRSLAATQASRFSSLAAQNAASQQEADTQRGNYAATRSQHDQAEAEVDRLKALIDFNKLVAPFAGTVTARNTDIGALIATGSGGGMPLFTVSDLSRLRLYVNVPQNEVANINAGLKAHFTVPSFPGRTFTAAIERTAQAIDPQSGTMLVQLVYDNRAGLLKPGSYADVSIALPPPDRTDQVLRVPASALLFRAGGTALAVAGQDGKVRIAKIGIITDLGTELQVHGDLSAQDWVIDSPPDALSDGDKVKTKPQQANRHA